MSGQLRANLAHLDASAVQADGQAAELATGHTCAHGQIESAQTGWTGRSAMSLAKRLVQWQAADAALQARVVEHGQALKCAATEYATTDQRSAEQVEQAKAEVERLASRQNL
ncbi:WXG100 family type VII secretion target [Mycolicibacterium holsaticum]|uniref:WXG100 family type VII secretion target n=1 Tax=Mycolicibacterium holsaticum TaxID=152142 RepID=UPI001C7D34B9|nr:WXG100 family type VII secretion target [Mycolicibacterium holsaticum]QZA11808.1 WXG100 family type VII secretion target [Mycolicibacterium holsaticum DSM 44478 = JCM 12374]UNC10704.1 WXG100 family type VII secretion target [Mycolicibacterium holsaticum DSM 44478 = JCM 12374]